MHNDKLHKLDTNFYNILTISAHKCQFHRNNQNLVDLIQYKSPKYNMYTKRKYLHKGSVYFKAWMCREHVVSVSDSISLSVFNEA